MCTLQLVMTDREWLWETAQLIVYLRHINLYHFGEYNLIFFVPLKNLRQAGDQACYHGIMYYVYKKVPCTRK